MRPRGGVLPWADSHQRGPLPPRHEGVHDHRPGQTHRAGGSLHRHESQGESQSATGETLMSMINQTTYSNCVPSLHPVGESLILLCPSFSHNCYFLVRPSVSPVLWRSNNNSEWRVLWDLWLLHFILWRSQSWQWKCQEEEGGGGENCKATPRGKFSLYILLINWIINFNNFQEEKYRKL